MERKTNAFSFFFSNKRLWMENFFFLFFLLRKTFFSPLEGWLIKDRISFQMPFQSCFIPTSHCKSYVFLHFWRFSFADFLVEMLLCHGSYILNWNLVDLKMWIKLRYFCSLQKNFENILVVRRNQVFPLLDEGEIEERMSFLSKPTLPDQILVL